MRIVALFIAVGVGCVAVGCGPTRTAGTKGVPANQLAALRVTQQYDVPFVQVAAVAFDDGAKYKIDGDRDFYLTPGVHRVALDLMTNVDVPMKWLSSSLGQTKIEGPNGLTTGDLKPGRTYELRGLAGTIQGMVTDEEMAITRDGD